MKLGQKTGGPYKKIVGSKTSIGLKFRQSWSRKAWWLDRQYLRNATNYPIFSR